MDNKEKEKVQVCWWQGYVANEADLLLFKYFINNRNSNSVVPVLVKHSVKHRQDFCWCFFCCFLLAFPSYISGVHHFWVRFLRTWPFFNPTIKVVTFRLRGCCVLGVFLLPAWTSGSLESMRWNARVHRLDLGLYSHPKEFLGEWSLNPC